MESIVLEFEQVTKYPLIQFLAKYRSFMLNSYPEINRYLSGFKAPLAGMAAGLFLLVQIVGMLLKILALFVRISWVQYSL